MAIKPEHLDELLSGYEKPGDLLGEVVCRWCTMIQASCTARAKVAGGSAAKRSALVRHSRVPGLRPLRQHHDIGAGVVVERAVADRVGRRRRPASGPRCASAIA